MEKEHSIPVRSLQGFDTVVPRDDLPARIRFFTIILLNGSGDDQGRVFGSLEGSKGRASQFQVKTLFEHQPNYRSHLCLYGSFPRKNPETTESDDPTSFFTIRLGVNAIPTGVLSVTNITDDTDLPDVLRKDRTVRDIAQAGELCAVSLQYNPRHAQMVGVFGNPNIPMGTEALVRSFQRCQGRDTLSCTLYLRGGDEIANHAKGLREALDRERIDDPLDLWHLQHQGRHFVQFGSVTPAIERPVVARFMPQMTFSDYGEYFTVVGYGAVQEEEYTAAIREELEDFQVDMRVLEIPRAGNRRYFGFLDLRVIRMSLASGELLSISLTEKPTREEQWTAVVVENLPIAPFGFTTVVLTRPSEEDERGNHTYVETPLAALAGDIFHSKAEARESIARYPPIKVALTVVSSDKTLQTQIHAMRTLDLAESSRAVQLRSILVGSAPKDHSSVNLYGGLPATKVHDLIKGLSLTPSQQRAIQAAQNLPGGIGLVLGPPGTGKTHFICQSALPLVMIPREDTTTSKILVVSPSNEQVDDIAVKIAKTFEARGLHKVVVRYHAVGTEESLIRRQANLGKAKPPTRTPLLDPVEAGKNALVAGLDVARFITDFFEQATHRPHGVEDPRLKKIELSLGMWMLRVSGIIPAEGATQHLQRWTVFRQRYWQYMNSELETSEERRSLDSEIRELGDAVLAQADVVVCTSTHAGNAKLSAKFNPDVVYVDEAGKATEMDLVVSLAHEPRVVLLIGDDKQLRPIVLSHGRNDPITRLPRNCFAAQLMLSPLSRLGRLGYTSTMLTEQHRMAGGLSKLPSRQFYQGRLLDSPTTALAERPMARKFLEWREGFAPDASGPVPQLLVDVPKSVCARVGTSRYNVHTAAVVVNIVEHLLRSGVSSHEIAIMSPYRGQCQVYQSSLRSLQMAQPDLDVLAIKVRTIDGFQGGESTYVIFDIVVTDDPGFTKDNHRLNVAFTRVRDGLIVVADMNAIWSTVGPRRVISTLARLLNEMRKGKYETTVAGGTEHARNEHVQGILT